MPEKSLYISYSDDWNQKQAKFVKDILKSVLEGFAQFSNCEVSVRLTGDGEIKELNKRYRNIDKPTNVLSFSLENNVKHSEKIMLGDIVISKDTIDKECEELEKSFESHLAFMVVHGFLHLLGFTHNKMDEAKLMEGQEIQILKKIGFSNPYEEEI